MRWRPKRPTWCPNHAADAKLRIQEQAAALQSARSEFDLATATGDWRASMSAWVKLQVAADDKAAVDAQQAVYLKRRSRRLTALVFVAFFGLVFLVLGLLQSTLVAYTRVYLEVNATQLQLHLTKRWEDSTPVNADAVRVAGLSYIKWGGNGGVEWPVEAANGRGSLSRGQFELLSEVALTRLSIGVPGRIELSSNNHEMTLSIPGPVSEGRVLTTEIFAVSSGVLNLPEQEQLLDAETHILAYADGPLGDDEPRLTMNGATDWSADFNISHAEFRNPERRSSVLGGTISVLDMDRAVALKPGDEITIEPRLEGGDGETRLRWREDGFTLEWTVEATELSLRSAGRPSRNLMPTYLDLAKTHFSAVSIFWSLVVASFGVVLWLLGWWTTWKV